MSTKVFLLLFSALMLAQCVLANSSEENASGSSEEKACPKYVTNYVSKLYTKLVDKTITATQRSFETIINDVRTNKVQMNPKVHEKLNELEKLLDEANTDTNEEISNKKRYFNDLGRICNELRRVEQEITNPTDGDNAVRRAHDDAGNEFDENLRTFVNRAMRAVERYLNTLSAEEQKERHELRDTLTEIKNATSIPKKLELLDKIFIFNYDT